MTVAEWKRPSPETAPCRSKAAGLYMICTLSKHAAESKGYNDALMLDYRGLIAEETGANVFLVQDGKIHTPKPDCFLDRKSVVSGKSVSVRVELGGRRIIKKKKTSHNNY